MDQSQSFDERLKFYLERVEDQRRWSQIIASRSGKSHRRLRVVTGIGAVVVPIISNLPFTFQAHGHVFDTSRIAITLIGLFVALSIALLTSGK